MNGGYAYDICFLENAVVQQRPAIALRAVYYLEASAKENFVLLSPYTNSLSKIITSTH